MDENIKIFKEYLEARFSNLKDIKHSFKQCSKNNGNYLVSSEVNTINFDKLTEWYKQQPVPHSADSLSFSDNYLYLIEFKSGDPTIVERKLEKLIYNVIDKINDSDNTLTCMYNEAFEKQPTRLNQRFCLVVDSKKLGISPLVSVLAELSLNNNNNKTEKEKILFERVRPDLKDGVQNPEHYNDVEICYSELFDKYLTLKAIHSSTS